jgi:hypothetical protein
MLGRLYTKANESFGRHGIVWATLFYGLPFLSVGAAATWAASALSWYWHWFRWLGVIYAVLFSWTLLTLLIICVRALLWQGRSRHRSIPRPVAEGGTTEAPILSPSQENLLALLAKYQRQYTTHKLIISGSKGTLHFDGQPERGKDVHLFIEMFGSDSPESSLKFEILMDSMPAAFVTRIPESRLDSPFVVALTEAGLRYLRDRNFHAAIPPLTSPPRIDICFEKRAPYEVSDISHQHVLSMVRIGLKNSGGQSLPNCKVYIERMSPEPAYPGGFPLLLAGSGFTLRHDGPETLVDVASHWSHVGKYKFNVPISGNFSDSIIYIDDMDSRTMVIKVEAGEYVRSATFKIWTDSEKALHLEFVSYTA